MYDVVCNINYGSYLKYVHKLQHTKYLHKLQLMYEIRQIRISCIRITDPLWDCVERHAYVYVYVNKRLKFKDIQPKSLS